MATMTELRAAQGAFDNMTGELDALEGQLKDVAAMADRLDARTREAKYNIAQAKDMGVLAGIVRLIALTTAQLAASQADLCKVYKGMLDHAIEIQEARRCEKKPPASTPSPSSSPRSVNGSDGRK